MEYFPNFDFYIIWLFFLKILIYKVFKLNYKIFFIDYTYKINIYYRLLYTIIRVIPINVTYYIRFIFLVIKKIKNY